MKREEYQNRRIIDLFAAKLHNSPIYYIALYRGFNTEKQKGKMKKINVTVAEYHYFKSRRHCKCSQLFVAGWRWCRWSYPSGCRPGVVSGMQNIGRLSDGGKQDNRCIQPAMQESDSYRRTRMAWGNAWRSRKTCIMLSYQFHTSERERHPKHCIPLYQYRRISLSQGRSGTYRIECHRGRNGTWL